MIPNFDTFWTLPHRRIGKKTCIYHQLPSTNSLALEWGSDPKLDGQALIAWEQTGGRGQYGRTWIAPPKSSVLLSILLFPPASLCRPPLMTAWAAVSVWELLKRTTGMEPRIKWPNDIYLSGKKVCGILIEQRRAGNSPPALVAGIGLNLAQPADFFEDAQLPLGGSLFSVAGKNWDPEEIAKQLLFQLDEEYDHLCQGNFEPLETRWREGIGLLGKAVEMETAPQNYRGILHDLSLDGIIVESDFGELIQVSPEVVRQLRGIG